MADVFVSYAREDQPVVRLLHDALAKHGRETWVDWEGIEPSDRWLRSILEAIDHADAVVVVLSPDWLASEVCRAEAEHAIASGKRLIPVVARDVEPMRATVPPALAELNWVFAREGIDDLDNAAAAIVRALDTNLELVRTHTLVLTRARAWEAAGRRRSPLLRGDELRRAEDWLARAAGGTKPSPTDLQAAFVAASRSAATRRTRFAVGGSLTVATVSILLAALALVSRSQAVHQSHVASSHELTADSAAELGSDPELSLLLAQQALSSNANPAARLAFVTALDRTAVRSIVHFGGVDGSVIGSAWSPDARLVALAGQDGSVGLWDPVANRIVRRMSANRRGVNAVAFSPDGRLLAAGGDDDLVHIWDVSTGRLVRSLAGHTGFVLDVAFSPDGRFVAAGGKDGTGRIWDVASGRDAVTIRDPGSITGIAIGPGNRFVVTSNESNGTTKVWSPDGQVASAYRPELRSQAPYHLALSPDGNVVAIAGLDGSVRLWRWRTSSAPRVLAASADPLIAVSFDRSGRLLAAGGQDGIARIWNVAAGTVLETCQGSRGVVDDVSFGPDGRHLVTADGDGTARLWAVTGEIGAVERVVTEPGRAGGLITGAVSPRSDLVVAAAVDGVVHAWHARSGDPAWHRQVGGPGGPAELSFDASGTLIAAPVATGVELLRSGDGAVVRTIRAGPELSVGLSPSGRLVAAGGRDNRVRVWDAQSGRLLYSNVLGRAEGSADDVRFSPDGKLLAVAIDAGRVLLWDASTGKELRALSGPTDPVLRLAFTPDGTLLAGGSSDRRAWLWNVSTGDVVRTFEGDTGPVGAVAVSPDGRFLATASDDRTARLWDLRTGDEIRLLSGDTDWVTSVGFAPDGDSVATTSLDGTLRVWDACSWCGSAAGLNLHAKPALARCLTPDEVAIYLHRPGTAARPCAA